MEIYDGMKPPREQFQPSRKFAAGNEDFVKIRVSVEAGRKAGFYKHGNAKPGKFLF